MCAQADYDGDCSAPEEKKIEEASPSSASDSTVDSKRRLMEGHKMTASNELCKESEEQHCTIEPESPAVGDRFKLTESCSEGKEPKQVEQNDLVLPDDQQDKKMRYDSNKIVGPPFPEQYTATIAEKNTDACNFWEKDHLMNGPKDGLHLHYKMNTSKDEGDGKIYSRCTMSRDFDVDNDYFNVKVNMKVWVRGGMNIYDKDDKLVDQRFNDWS